MAMKGKTAVVTGAGMGIGRAIALGFVGEGVSVVVADINEAAGLETVELIKKKGGKAIFVKCDVSKREDVKTMVVAAVKAFGSLDYGCNNAGIHPEVTPVPFTDIQDDQWDLVMSVNLKGVFYCMQEELRQMEKQNFGVIVNTASMAGLLIEPGFSVSTVSKHGVMGLTKSAAFMYVKRGIRINAIWSAPVDTPMYRAAPKEVAQMLETILPMGRVATAEEVASAALYLCSDSASYITGIGLPIDGGVGVA